VSDRSPHNDEAPPPNAIPIAPGLFLPEAALSFTFSRSGGPGGQNVNKLSTKATLDISLDHLAPLLGPAATQRLIDLAGSYVTSDNRLVIAADEHRSQIANKKACIDRLRELIIRARIRPKIRRKTKPTRGSQQRRIDEKKRRGDIKRGRSEF
jgi:ribosome-associated protein